MSQFPVQGNTNHPWILLGMIMCIALFIVFVLVSHVPSSIGARSTRHTIGGIPKK